MTRKIFLLLTIFVLSSCQKSKKNDMRYIPRRLGASISSAELFVKSTRRKCLFFFCVFWACFLVAFRVEWVYVKL
jgi:hypothetical protein